MSNGLTGARGQAFRRWLFSDAMWGTTPLCFHCAHRIAPGLGEVQHLISPSVRPDLAMSVVLNLRPAHGGGKRRCPECDLACNAIAASNTAPRDAHGRPLPFPPDYLAAKIRERQAHVAAQPRRPVLRAVPAPAREPAEHGRVW